MELGDKEWFEKLKKISQFPATFAFYVSSDKTIQSQLLKTKAQDVGNIQYKTLRPPVLFGGEDCALASVTKCETPMDYYKECVKLRERWGVPKA